MSSSTETYFEIFQVYPFSPAVTMHIELLFFFFGGGVAMGPGEAISKEQIWRSYQLGIVFNALCRSYGGWAAVESCYCLLPINHGHITTIKWIQRYSM